MEHLLVILMKVPFSQQSNVGLYWQGIPFPVFSAPSERGQRKAARLGLQKNLLWADQGMEMLLGANWGKISWPSGCKLLPASKSYLWADRRGEDVSLQQELWWKLEKNTIRFRKTGVSKPLLHSALRLRVGASVSSFSLSAYRSDITELIMTSLWRAEESLKSSIQQQRNVRFISQ